MREQGYLEGHKDFAMFPEAYEWMIEQMKKRIAHCAMENYPIWLWQRRPNRNEKALARKGERWVILKLDIPENQILWSSFDVWHAILNNSPITYAENEWDNFKKKGFPQKEVIQTWEQLFNYQWLANRPFDWAGDYQKH